jgi:hypothetical protein
VNELTADSARTSYDPGPPSRADLDAVSLLGRTPVAPALHAPSSGLSKHAGCTFEGELDLISC